MELPSCTDVPPKSPNLSQIVPDSPRNDRPMLSSSVPRRWGADAAPYAYSPTGSAGSILVEAAG